MRNLEPKTSVLKRYLRLLRAVGITLVTASLFAGVALAQQTIAGVSGGALYKFIVPNPWNGQLVLYAHGAVPAGEPLALPNSPLELAAFQAVASQGFAIGMSSYGENGWAEKDGAQSTHQLKGLFTSLVGSPVRTYVAGVSLGGLITVDLTESFPREYDGALSLCGVVGGAQLQFQRRGDGRVVFDYFFPGVLPVNLLQFDFSPGSPVYLAALNAMVQGLATPGQPTLQFANVLKLPGSNANEIIFSALVVLGGFGDLLERTHGHNFYDN